MIANQCYEVADEGQEIGRDASDLQSIYPPNMTMTSMCFLQNCHAGDSDILAIVGERYVALDDFAIFSSDKEGEMLSPG